MELPFPYPGGKKPTDSFQFHELDVAADVATFMYMGRERFQHLLLELPAPRVNIAAARASLYGAASAVSSLPVPAAAAAALPSLPATAASASAFFPPILRGAGTKPGEMFIYGTIGWGKSHLLAAMACLLLRKGRKIVFLPDCKMMLHDPVDYFRSALLLTYAAEPAVQAQVACLGTVEGVISFCKRHHDLTYIIDQFNALEQDMKKDDAETLEKKAIARRLIDHATFDRALVKAASANNFTARVIHDKQLNMNIQTLFGGMTQVQKHDTPAQQHSLGVLHCADFTLFSALRPCAAFRRK